MDNQLIELLTRIADRQGKRKSRVTARKLDIAPNVYTVELGDEFIATTNLKWASILTDVLNLPFPSILSALREQQRMREASKKALGLLHECFRQLDGVKQGVCKTCGRDRAIWQACETGCLSSRLSYAIHEMTLARAALKESEVKDEKA
jgi:hypothetical protein